MAKDNKAPKRAARRKGLGIRRHRNKSARPNGTLVPNTMRSAPGERRPRI